MIFFYKNYLESNADFNVVKMSFPTYIVVYCAFDLPSPKYVNKVYKFND